MLFYTNGSNFKLKEIGNKSQEYKKRKRRIEF